MLHARCRRHLRTCQGVHQRRCGRRDILGLYLRDSAACAWRGWDTCEQQRPGSTQPAIARTTSAWQTANGMSGVHAATGWLLLWAGRQRTHAPLAACARTRITRTGAAVRHAADGRPVRRHRACCEGRGAQCGISQGLHHLSKGRGANPQLCEGHVRRDLGPVVAATACAGAGADTHMAIMSKAMVHLPRPPTHTPPSAQAPWAPDGGVQAGRHV